MSILWLLVFAFLVGLATYRIFYTLVKSVRLVMAFASIATFLIIVQNLETIGHIWNSAGALPIQFFSNNRTRNALNPNERPDPVTDVAFQSIIREDQNFLNEFTQAQSQTGQSPGTPTPLQVAAPGRDGIVRAGDESRLKTELAINPLRVKRAVLVPHKETVKRAQLVTQNEASKRTEVVRSGQR
jgi:hypothetical protein